MSPAIAPREHCDIRMLVMDPSRQTVGDRRFVDLPRLLRAGDLLVVNDAATLPASLAGVTDGGECIEARLVSLVEGGRWRVILFGEGDWHTRTENRPGPPALEAGASLRFGDLRATVVSVPHPSGRLFDLAFDLQGAAFWDALYRHGRPVQYSHLHQDLDLWSVQTAYASRPWAVEMPSAGRPLTWGLLGELRSGGIGLATLTHAAGLSATGDAQLDASLPMPERYDIPAPTITAVADAQARGGRVIAVGTSVVRALEGAAQVGGGSLRAGSGVTDLRITPNFVPRVVDGLISGIHDPTESHFQLVRAFAPQPLLDTALQLATRRGYLTHEFGDSCLVLEDRSRAPTSRSIRSSATRHQASLR